MTARLKTIVISSLISFSAFAAIVYTSCNRDKCKTVVCAYGGVCNDGVCNCRPGYEGTNCETISRQKFLGNWSVFEKGSITEASQYGISITEGPKINDVIIKNFYNYFVTPIAGVVKNDTLFIPNQQYEGKVLFGIGYIYTSVTYTQFGAIDMKYEIVDTATQAVNDFGYNSKLDHSDPSRWNK
jgi:hypothetical protein